MPPSEVHIPHALATRRQPLCALAGLPSAGLVFASHTLSEILRRTYGAVIAHAFNREEHCDLAQAVESGDPVLLFIDVPDISIAPILKGRGFSSYLVEDDFIETAIYCMAARNLTVLEAARFISQSVCCLMGLAADDSVRRIQVRRGMPIADWIDYIADLAGLVPNKWHAARDQMQAEYARFGTVEMAMYEIVHFAARAETDPSVCLPEEREILAAVAPSYGWEPAREIWWPSDVLLDAGKPNYPAVSGPIDLTGSARALTFGPYLHLPPGRWIAEYGFEAGENVSGNAYSFDIHADGEVKFYTQGLMTTSGRFSVKCEFETEDPTLPVEVRCFIREGAIEGFLRPLGITLRRSAGASGLAEQEKGV